MFTLKLSCLLDDSFLERGNLNTALPKQFRSMGLCTNHHWSLRRKEGAKKTSNGTTVRAWSHYLLGLCFHPQVEQKAKAAGIRKREQLWTQCKLNIWCLPCPPFSVSCVLSAGLQPIQLQQHNSLQGSILNWIRNLIQFKKNLAKKCQSCDRNEWLWKQLKWALPLNMWC